MTRVWFLVLLLPVIAIGAPTYSGSLDLTGSGFGANSSISWIVNFDEGYGLWDYRYLLTSECRDISHLLLEISANATSDNIIASEPAPEGGPQWYSPGPSTPGLPEEFFAVKWEPGEETKEFSWEFLSDRAPVWGDVYWKDGSIAGVVWNAGWNPGFTADDVDPLVAVHCGPEAGHLLVPDSSPVIPAPGAIVLAALGTGIVGLFRRRRLML